MSYELYIDVLFIVNTLMNFYILALVKKVLGCTATYFRIFLVSAASGALTIGVMILPVESIIMKYSIIHLGINMITIKTALRLKGRQALLKGAVLLYGLTFIFGGVLNWLSFILRMNAEIMLLAGFFLFLLLRAGIVLYRCLKSMTDSLYEVTVVLNAGQIQVTGLLDTGNSLWEPVSKKPVNIVPLDVIKGLLTRQQLLSIEDFSEYGTEYIDTTDHAFTGIRYVPYCSVGKKNGLLPVLYAEKIELVRGSERREVIKPLLGICQNDFVSGKRYQMILNPSLFN